MKAKLKPLSTSELRSCSLGAAPKPKKAGLEPLATHQAFSFPQAAPTFPKQKSFLESCSAFSPPLFGEGKLGDLRALSKLEVALEKKKVTLEPLSNCPAVPLCLHPPKRPDPVFRPDKKTQVASKKKNIIDCSKFSLTSPAPGEAVSSFHKKKGNLGPVSLSSSPSSPALQKSSSLPSLDSIPMRPSENQHMQRPQTVPDAITAKQKAFGSQSLRGGMAKSDPFEMLNDNPHAKSCFQDLLMTEEKMCEEWAIFYHSYSTSALMYEVQAAIAAVLFGFRSQNGTLPRILLKDFLQVPDATALQRLLGEDRRKRLKKGIEDFHDGLDEYMAVGLSAMCSLLAHGPEASPTSDSCKGYSSSSMDASWDPDLSAALNKLLKSCCVPSFKIQKLTDDIIKLSEKHGLDVSSFNGKQCNSKQPGHLLQICIRRDIVDKLVYASQPFGHPDEARQPMSRWIDSNSSKAYGQARILARPEYFMEPDAVRLHTVSADPKFHLNRESFQKELTELLSLILGDASSREDAAKNIYGGVLPDRWTSDEHQSSRFCRPALGARHCIKVRQLPGEL